MCLYLVGWHTQKVSVGN